MDCLDEETILQFAAHSLPPDRDAAVRRHLDTCSDCRSLIAMLAQPNDASARTIVEEDEATLRNNQRSSTASPVAVGDVIADRWKIEKLIGSGGMGYVVAARHVELRSKVAIKFLHRDLLDAEVLTRFEREARALATIESEHVVKVHDFGRHDGMPYLVMDFLEGENLGTLGRGAPLPWRLALEYAIQAARGLVDAHARGIIHRDIKPTNLFYIPAKKRVLLLDFGLAKVPQQNVEDAPTSVSKLTLTSEFLGTPTFMAPEQIIAARDVDARADVWSFGATFYQLVTGHPPFVATNLQMLVSLITDMDRQSRPPRESIPDLPVEVEALLLRCLEKDRSRRFKSMTELLTELERLQLALVSTRVGALKPPIVKKASRSPMIIAIAGTWMILGALVVTIVQLEKRDDSASPEPTTTMVTEDAGPHSHRADSAPAKAGSVGP